MERGEQEVERSRGVERLRERLREVERREMWRLREVERERLRERG